MKEQSAVPLAQLTTLRVGGPARRVVEVTSQEDIVAAVREADEREEPVLVMGAGSNLLVGDDGFAGTVLRVANRGGTMVGEMLVVGAGEPWDAVVGRAVADGLSGIECLSGIPGLTGATPIQNVGAYGQEVAQTIVFVKAYDRQSQSVCELAPEQCGFGYRTSAFKRSDRHVVLAVGFDLERSGGASRPISYPELARRLGVQVGERAPLADVREAVMALRRTKGMVLDPADPDSVSAGSFFLNPVLTTEEFAALEQRVRARLGADTPVPAWPEQDGGIKVSAAWLIERAGFQRGHGDGRAGISSKHTLALVNRGGASATELVTLARELRDTVRSTFGVTLAPEPTLVGLAL